MQSINADSWETTASVDFLCEVKMELTKGKKNRPRLMVVYGAHGKGKSTLGSEAPDHLFLNYEDGLDEIGPNRTPHLATFADHVEAWRNVVDGVWDFNWLVIDAIDSVETMLTEKVCNEHNVDAINDIGYGVGKQSLRKEWNKFLAVIKHVRDKMQKNVLVIAHDMVIPQRDPEHPEYDKHYPKLVNKDFSEALVEVCDEVLYCFDDLRFTEEKGAFGRKEVKVRSGNGVLLRTTGKPSVTAKRRLKLEDVIPMDWEVIQEAIDLGVE